MKNRDHMAPEVARRDYEHLERAVLFWGYKMIRGPETGGNALFLEGTRSVLPRKTTPWGRSGTCQPGRCEYKCRRSDFARAVVTFAVRNRRHARFTREKLKTSGKSEQSPSASRM